VEPTEDGETRVDETTSSELPPGTVIGIYRLLEQIGQGGMGTVYRADETALDCLGVIKVIAREELLGNMTAIGEPLLQGLNARVQSTRA
jgi:serine/threonine protein kinase